MNFANKLLTLPLLKLGTILIVFLIAKIKSDGHRLLIYTLIVCILNQSKSINHVCSS